MAVVLQGKAAETVSGQSSNKQNWEAVRILDIILNINHPKFEDYGGYDSIGTIYYTKLNNNIPNEQIWASTANIAKPLFSHLKYYPLINEIVLIVDTYDKNIYNSSNKSSYYLPQVNIWNHPHHNALPSVNGLESEATSNDYQQTENGIIRRVEDGSTDIPLGEYFKENSNIKPLLPYEGDMVIEGRFGNSIRFGSTNIGESIPNENKNQWSQIGKTGDPITIIRNGQPEETDKKGWVPLIEDSNKDASIIYMTSNQQITEFTPASFNQQSFGANIESQTSWDQELSDPNPPVSRTPVMEEEEEEDNTATLAGIESEPITSTTYTPASQEEEEEEEDELTPFDRFIGNDEEEWHIIELLEQTEPGPEDFLENPNSSTTSSTTSSTNSSTTSLNDAQRTAISSIPVSYPATIPNTVEGKNYASLHLHLPISATAMVEKISSQAKNSSKTILCLHTSNSPPNYTHIEVAAFFMSKWSRHGYDITIEPNGSCIQIYEDTGLNSFGVGSPDLIPRGKTESKNKSPKTGPLRVDNANTINITWIGGSKAAGLDMTRQQAAAYKVLIEGYVKKYPDIKIVGHNQFRGKECPWFWVPDYLKLLSNRFNEGDGYGIKPKNIYPATNPMDWGMSTHKEPFIQNAKDVFNITPLKNSTSPPIYDVSDGGLSAAQDEESASVSLNPHPDAYLAEGNVGFYLETQGPKNKIIAKDENMNILSDLGFSFSASIETLIQEAKYNAGLT